MGASLDPRLTFPTMKIVDQHFLIQKLSSKHLDFVINFFKIYIYLSLYLKIKSKLGNFRLLSSASPVWAKGWRPSRRRWTTSPKTRRPRHRLVHRSWSRQLLLPQLLHDPFSPLPLYVYATGLDPQGLLIYSNYCVAIL